MGVITIRQIIEQCFGLFLEERSISLNAWRQDALAYVEINLICDTSAKIGSIVLSKQGDRLSMDRHFSRWLGDKGIDLLLAAL
ncbi:hypothetical protein D3C73_1423150 [compost metagenome]